MPWERKPDVDDLLRAIDRYVSAREAKRVDQRRVDEHGGHLNREIAFDFSEASKTVGEVLNSIIDDRVEARLKGLGTETGNDL